MIGQGGERPAAGVVGQLGGPLEQPAVQVEDVARVGLAARRAAQQQRHLAVGLGLLGQVVVDDEGVLAVVHPVLAHGAAGVGGQVLERGGVGGAGQDHHRVLEGAVALEGGHGLGDRGLLLADGDVDALHPQALLVEDGVDGDGGLARLAVADDELALAAADRGHGVDGLDAGLQRLAHRLALDDARGLDLEAAGLGGGDGALAVERLAQGVDHPAEQGVAHPDREDAAGRLDQLLLLEAGVLAQDDGADGLLVEVEGQALGPVLELEDLVDRAAGQAGDAGDAVADLDDAADLLGPDLGRVVVDVLLERGGDLVGVDGQLSHRLLPFVLGFLESGRPPRRRGGAPSVRRAGGGCWSRPAGRRPGRPRRPAATGSTVTCRSTGLPVSDGQRLGSGRAAGRRPPRRRPGPGPPASPGPWPRPRPACRGWPRCRGPGRPGRRRRPGGPWPGRALPSSSRAMTSWRTTTGRSRSPRAWRSAPVGLDGPGEPEQLVLDLLELGDRAATRRRRRRSPTPGCASPCGRGPPRRTARRRWRPPGWPGARAGLPIQRNEATTSPAGHDGDGLVDEAGDLGPGLARRAGGRARRAARGHRDRPVVDGQEEVVVALDEVGDGVQLRAGVGQPAVGGQRLLHRGQVALEGRVHRAPPAPAAAPALSARTAAMASSMRSWWSDGVDLPADDPLGGGQDDLAHPGGHLLDGGLAGHDHLGVGRRPRSGRGWPGPRRWRW